MKRLVLSTALLGSMVLAPAAAATPPGADIPPGWESETVYYKGNSDHVTTDPNNGSSSDTQSGPKGVLKNNNTDNPNYQESHDKPGVGPK